MSMQDPIAVMLTVIRNGKNAKKEKVLVSFSRMKVAIIHVLQEEGFINRYNVINGIKSNLEIFLKYYTNKKPVIDNIKQISKPGLRIYKRKSMLPCVMSGMGIVIISTSKGIITDKKARQINVGGEILCYVS